MTEAGHETVSTRSWLVWRHGASDDALDAVAALRDLSLSWARFGYQGPGDRGDEEPGESSSWPSTWDTSIACCWPPERCLTKTGIRPTGAARLRTRPSTMLMNDGDFLAAGRITNDPQGRVRSMSAAFWSTSRVIR